MSLLAHFSSLTCPLSRGWDWCPSASMPGKNGKRWWLAKLPGKQLFFLDANHAVFGGIVFQNSRSKFCLAEWTVKCKKSLGRSAALLFPEVFQQQLSHSCLSSNAPTCARSAHFRAKCGAQNENQIYKLFGIKTFHKDVLLLVVTQTDFWCLLNTQWHHR